MTQVCEAFMVVAELAQSLGAINLNKKEGCWVHPIDDQWTVAMNPHRDPVVCNLSTVPIEPFHLYVQYNGWPAGIMTPFGGAIAAGECANENTFIDAVRDAIKRHEAQP